MRSRGSLPGQGDSTRRGAGQAQGAGLCGAASLRLPPARLWFPGAFSEGGGGSGLTGPRGGACLLASGPGPTPFPGSVTRHTLPPLAPSVWGQRQRVLEGARGAEMDTNSGGPSSLAKCHCGFPGAPKSGSGSGTVCR